MAKKQKKITLPPNTNIPNHIAIVLDGNRRWARSRGLQPWEGHAAGYDTVYKLAHASRQMGVHTFTVWAFSTENWGRSQVEIQAIMNIFRKALTVAKKEAVEEKVRMKHIGRKDRLPADIVSQIYDLEEMTKNYSEHTFNFAVDYGGHDEILRAVRRVVDDRVPSAHIDAKLFESYLDTADQTYPYVDLFIRTSGEQRTSGLFPWQLDYAEYYFESEHLPDFGPQKLKEAVLDFSRRRRRFGVNDSEKHLHFDPKVVAELDIKWRHALDLRQGERLRDLAIRYVKEYYGLSKNLAKEAGLNMAKAVVYGEEKNWQEAKKALVDLYGIVQKTLKLAFEPQLVANIEVDLWRNGQDEESLRHFLAEKFRVSTFQAAKSAHLAYLANREVSVKNWNKARDYMEKFYQALKEHVA